MLGHRLCVIQQTYSLWNGRFTALAEVQPVATKGWFSLLSGQWWEDQILTNCSDRRPTQACVAGRRRVYGYPRSQWTCAIRARPAVGTAWPDCPSSKACTHKTAVAAVLASAAAPSSDDTARGPLSGICRIEDRGGRAAEASSRTLRQNSKPFRACGGRSSRAGGLRQTGPADRDPCEATLGLAGPVLGICAVGRGQEAVSRISKIRPGEARTHTLDGSWAIDARAGETSRRRVTGCLLR